MIFAAGTLVQVDVRNGQQEAKIWTRQDTRGARSRCQGSFHASPPGPHQHNGRVAEKAYIARRSTSLRGVTDRIVPAHDANWFLLPSCDKDFRILLRVNYCRIGQRGQGRQDVTFQPRRQGFRFETREQCRGTKFICPFKHRGSAAALPRVRSCKAVAARGNRGCSGKARAHHSQARDVLMALFLPASNDSTQAWTQPLCRTPDTGIMRTAPMIAERRELLLDGGSPMSGNSAIRSGAKRCAGGQALNSSNMSRKLTQIIRYRCGAVSQLWLAATHCFTPRSRRHRPSKLQSPEDNEEEIHVAGAQEQCVHVHASALSPHRPERGRRGVVGDSRMSGQIC